MCKEQASVIRNKLTKFVGKQVKIRVGDYGTLNKVYISAVDSEKVRVIYSNSENDIPMTYGLSLIKEVEEV